ncbi:MAG: helix-turn-helix transcriptional regulator [Clostridia bacterium]|nr:helix-turn-helix transcriptional regulator [Clostridia bacterium]
MDEENTGFESFEDLTAPQEIPAAPEETAAEGGSFETPEETAEPEKEDKADNQNSISADIIRGHINTIILRSLYERDKYGWEIMEEIETKCHGQYTMKQPTLYSALKRLEKNGYITAYWKTGETSQGGRRKYFTLTDSGREMSELNQSEWEYSRTIIDSLISDKDYDFTKEPPKAGPDFTPLKEYTTRVPMKGKGKSTDDDEDEDEPQGRIVNLADEPPAEEPAPAEPEEEPIPEPPVDIVEVVPVPVEPEPAPPVEEPAPAEPEPVAEEPAVEEPEPVPEPVPEEPQEEEPQIEVVETTETVMEVATPEPVTETVIIEEPAPEEPKAEEPQSEPAPQPENDEATQRKLQHERFIDLITDPDKAPVGDTPYSGEMNSENYIYNDRPANERDYRNIINSLFDNTINSKVQPEPAPAPPAPAPPAPAPAAAEPAPQVVYQQPEYIPYVEPVKPVEEPVVKKPAPTTRITNVRVDDITTTTRTPAAAAATASVAGNYDIQDNRKYKYNRGSILFRCSLIVGVVMLVEFLFTIIFTKQLGVGYGYPVVILVLDIAQFLIFLILSKTDFGNNSRKPASSMYLTITAIVNILVIVAVVVVCFLIDTNFASAGSVMANLVIPCIVSLSLTIFATIFYGFTKASK